MMAVDTLVHNWLHRTGLLASFDVEHPYGERCYGPVGCAALLMQLAHTIDARSFNASYPQAVPKRCLEHAISGGFCAHGSTTAAATASGSTTRKRCR